MDAGQYIRRSLLHYRFAYLGVFLGAVLGAMVLFGALFAGDSVEESLRQIGEKRTGQGTHLISAGDRFFREALAEDLVDPEQGRAAPLLFLRGTAVDPATQAVANQVQLIGVTAAFWQLAPEPGDVPLDAAASEVAVNETIARRLDLSSGDTLILRMQKPGILAGNAPVAGAEESLISIRCTVGRIVGDDSFGRFGIATTQISQPSVFLPLSLLQDSLGYGAKANLLLIEALSSEFSARDVLQEAMTLEDYGLSLAWSEEAAVFELTSDRVFIDPEVADAVMNSIPETQPVISYLVNEFRVADRSTPYSIATAAPPAAAPFLPADLGAGEIVLNQWLADDLVATVGDQVRVSYFRSGARGTIVEQDAALRVRAIVPMPGLAVDGSWMPDFPGISDVDGPSDWDPGLPLDLDLIRDQDERYWDDYRGAPKAFVSLTTGRELWSTRWGDFTALRIPWERDRQSTLENRLLTALRPELNQIAVQDFRTTAQDAATSPVDFGGLFIGMSFFLIAAALGLVAMLFQFCLLQRNREGALLGSVGVSARKLLRWRLGEGLVVLAFGCAAGLPLAVWYTQQILGFLESIWAGQGASPTFVFRADPLSIAGGTAGFLILSMLALWAAIRHQSRRTLSIRLATGTEESAPSSSYRRTSMLTALVAVVIGGVALSLSGSVLPAQGAFYLAGFALLVAGLALYRWWLGREERPETDATMDASRLGRLNVKARRSRSLTVVGLMATAVFMVLSVASFRKSVGEEWREHDSGTGGFSLWIDTTAPLNAPRDGTGDGFEIFATQAAEMGDIVPLRRGIGDNANCFNLNTTSQPQLLAVDVAILAERGAFNVDATNPATGATGWAGLQTPLSDGAIPAMVDETTLLWALKKKVGDVLVYADENGRQFPVQIVGAIKDSIFQGYLLLDEQLFLERFPSHPGYSLFLADVVNPADLENLSNALETAAVDVGGRVVSTRSILEEFHEIENTYIAIFHVLGTLGVILGSLGLALVVARNLRERRGEFAVMSAMGIPRKVLAAMVYAEFSRLVVGGLLVGVLSAALSVWPGLDSLPATPALLVVVLLLVGIVGLNLACGWCAFRWSFRTVQPQLEDAAR